MFHDLRRTAATMLKSLGVPARDAQTILGHANIAVTLGVYSEVFDTEIATALGRINDALGRWSTKAQSTAGHPTQSQDTLVVAARQPTKADARHRASALMSILCQTASPKIGRGRLLVGDTGIEPVTSSVSGKRSPAELIARGGSGNRTRVQGFAGRCLSHSATPPAGNEFQVLEVRRGPEFSERTTGFEPATLTLAR